MILRRNLDRDVVRLGVAPRGDAKELAPGVVGRRPVGVHGAVDHDRGRAAAVRIRDPLDQRFVGRVGEALVVDHDVEPFGPVRRVEQGLSSGRASTSLNGDRPIDRQDLRDRIDEQLRLKRIVVIPAAADDKGVDARLPGKGVGRPTASAPPAFRNLLRRQIQNREERRRNRQPENARVY